MVLLFDVGMPAHCVRHIQEILEISVEFTSGTVTAECMQMWILIHKAQWVSPQYI